MPYPTKPTSPTVSENVGATIGRPLISHPYERRYAPMKSFLIIGLGRFGEALARELFRLGHEVMAVDKDEDSVARIAD